MGKKFKMVREKEYKMIKVLLDADVAQVTVSKLPQIQRSAGTINFIAQSKNWEEFRTMRALRSRKRIEGRAKGLRAEKSQPVKSTKGIVSELKKTNQELAEIKKVFISIDTTLRLARKGGRLKLGSKW